MYLVMHNINDYDFQDDGGTVDYYVGLFEDPNVAISKCQDKLKAQLEEEDDDESVTIQTSQTDEHHYVVQLVNEEGEWTEAYHIYKPTLNEIG